MALIAQKDMTTLYSASEVKTVAASAVDDINIARIAAKINEAANTGETKIHWIGKIENNVLDTLKSKGYNVEKYDLGYYHISWN